MKLRNKKTGEVESVDYISVARSAFDLYSNEGNKKIASGISPIPLFYESLKELNEDWEDYKPAEPLIKDEKIRKAVRAWAELNITEVEINKIIMIDRCTLSIGNHGPRFETWNNTYYDNLQRGKEYTIAELCGEEEE